MTGTIQPLQLTSYPNPPYIPVASRCTINRNPAPGSRENDPFPGRLRDDPSRAAVQDTYASYTYEAEAVVPANSVVIAEFDGPVLQPCNSFHMQIFGFDPAGAVIPPLTLEPLLTPVVIRLTKNFATMHTKRGNYTFGVTFNTDLKGGEILRVTIDNTDPRSTVNGETFLFQLFLNCDPEYSIETGRKDNPIP